METLAKNDLLDFHPDTLQVVRKMYNLDKPGEMSNAVDIFEAWIKQQKHFVKKDFSRDYLERLIITSKGSIERAKSRLDKLCTLRTLLPQFFGEYDIKKDFKDVFDADIYYLAMPELTKNYERVYFIRLNGASTNTLLQSFRLCLMITEYLKSHDYAASYMLVVDLRKCNIAELVSKVGFMDMRNSTTLVTHGYGVRLTATHLLTDSKIVDTFIMLLKQVMSEKIAGRIIVHRTLESLYKYAPKDVLPVEFGGERRTLVEIHEKWLDVLSTEEYKKYRREMNAACTDESLRQTDKFNDQYLGMAGTFRNLKVD